MQKKNTLNNAKQNRDELSKREKYGEGEEKDRNYFDH